MPKAGEWFWAREGDEDSDDILVYQGTAIEILDIAWDIWLTIKEDPTHKDLFIHKVMQILCGVYLWCMSHQTTAREGQGTIPGGSGDPLDKTDVNAYTVC